MSAHAPHDDHAHDGHDHDHEGHDRDRHDHAGHDHPQGDHGAPPAPQRGPKHGFTPREARQAKRLAMVLAIVGAFFVFELAGALAARSVVLQADALHLLMDEVALAMSLVAMRLAVRKPTPRFTFGLRRAEPLAALFNSVLVLAATAEIVTEGVAELHGESHPRAMIMLVVAAGALVVNGLSAWLLHGAIHDHGHEGHDGHGHGAHSHAGHSHGDHAHAGDHAHPHDAPAGADAPKKPKRKGGHALNLRGVWLHLLGDALGSIAALVAAIAIEMGGPVAIDAIASFVVAAILIAAVTRLIRDATLVLLEAAPVHLPVGAVREVILAFPGIAEVHDLHVWTLGAGHDAITTHVRASTGDPTIARRLSLALREAFETEYVTVQVESREEECAGEVD